MSESAAPGPVILRKRSARSISGSAAKSQLGFWKVAVWGTIAFLLFSILFSYFFLTLLSFLTTHIPRVWTLPTPAIPGLVAGVLILLAVALVIGGLLKLRLWRTKPSRSDRLRHNRGSAELLARLLLLLIPLVIGSCLPFRYHIDASRCSLFTTQEVCVRYHGVLPQDSYDFPSYVGQNAGLYTRRDEGRLQIGNAWLDRFSYEGVHVERTRFGWPLRAITRDVVSGEREWHIVIESWLVANLLFWFACWLALQLLISLALWLFSSDRRRIQLVAGAQSEE